MSRGLKGDRGRGGQRARMGNNGNDSGGRMDRRKSEETLREHGIDHFESARSSTIQNNQAKACTHAER